MLQKCLLVICMLITGGLWGSHLGAFVKTNDYFYLNQMQGDTFIAPMFGIGGAVFFGAIGVGITFKFPKLPWGVAGITALLAIASGLVITISNNRKADEIAKVRQQELAVNANYAKNATATLDEFEQLTGFKGKRERDGEGEYHLKTAKAEALRQVVALGARDTTNGSLSATWTLNGQLISMGFNEESADTCMVTALVARSPR